MSAIRKIRHRGLWAAGLAPLVAIAGIVVAAGIAGDNPAVVEGQVIEVVDSASEVLINGSSSDDASFITLQDGQSFNASVKVQPGDKYQVKPAIKNNTDSDAFLLLTVDTPPGFIVDVSNATAVTDEISEVGQASEDTWIVVVDEAADGSQGDLVIEVEVDTSVVPGFYPLTMNLDPLE